MVHGNRPNFTTLVRHSWPFQRSSTVSQPWMVWLPWNKKQTYLLNSRPQMLPPGLTLDMTLKGKVTGVTSDVGVLSTHLVSLHSFFFKNHLGGCVGQIFCMDNFQLRCGMKWNSFMILLAAFALKCEYMPLSRHCFRATYSPFTNLSDCLTC